MREMMKSQCNSLQIFTLASPHVARFVLGAGKAAFCISDIRCMFLEDAVLINTRHFFFTSSPLNAAPHTNLRYYLIKYSHKTRHAKKMREKALNYQNERE